MEPQMHFSPNQSTSAFSKPIRKNREFSHSVDLLANTTEVSINKPKRRIAPNRPRVVLDVSGDFSDWSEIFEETATSRQMTMKDLE